MEVTILSESSFVESQWSGGSTKQLYIFPEDASYSDRNFQLRISTARVDAPESVFTALPGFDRKLMILEGEIVINHENHYSKVLTPFEVDSFSGDWITTAKGTCVDFNVMTVGTVKSELSIIQLERSQPRKIEGDSLFSEMFLFSLERGVMVKSDLQTYQLEKGHLFCIDQLSKENLELSSEQNAQLVMVRINR